MGIHAVGVPGVSNWKPHYSRILQDFEEVLVFADGDQAGRDFSKRLARDLDGVTIISCPEGEDVNSVYLNYGAGWFKERLDG
jgi:DNA primase